MTKYIYCGAIVLLFVILTVGMWFFPVGRDLKADKEFLGSVPATKTTSPSE